MATDEITLRSAEILAPGATSEVRLVERCRRGDAEAFARLVALHEAMVYHLAARLLGDVEEARDASQDVFLQVYRRLGGFEGRSSLKTWIYRIVLNHCRNRRRFFRRRHVSGARPLDALTPREEARIAERPGPQSGPFEALERREQAERVQAALLGLSFDHRAVLVLREVDGLTCEELAEALGIATGTVKSRLARAREALRRRLQPFVAEGGGA